MEDRKPPTWEEIRGLIDEVDQVCRESEYLRAHAERVMRRPAVWPDRRREPRKHDEPGRSTPSKSETTSHGGGGRL